MFKSAKLLLKISLKKRNYSLKKIKELFNLRFAANTRGVSLSIATISYVKVDLKVTT